MSDLCSESRQNWGDNVFSGLHVGTEEASLVAGYMTAHDFSHHTRRAIRNDLRKFVRWFNQANQEAFTIKRTTTRDVVDFRNHLQRDQRQAVASVNRALVSLRCFFGWLAVNGHVEANPAKQVKELRRQPLAPMGLDQARVRQLLREIELRQDTRAYAIFSLMLYTGCRVNDLVQLETCDLTIRDRTGSVVYRFGKGNKRRVVPLPQPARQALLSYFEIRPSVTSPKVFVGERGPLSDRGIRALCYKYSTIIGIRLYPHLFRHTMAHQFLLDNGNDLVALAQILGHDSLDTTSRYSQKNECQLLAAIEHLNY